MHFGKKILGCYGGNGDPSKDIARYLNTAMSGLIGLDKLVTEKVTLHQINDAIDGMVNGEIAGRVVVDLMKTD